MTVAVMTAPSTSCSAISKLRSVFCVAFRPKEEVLWFLWHTGGPWLPPLTSSHQHPLIHGVKH